MPLGYTTPPEGEFHYSLVATVSKFSHAEDRSVGTIDIRKSGTAVGFSCISFVVLKREQTIR